MKIKVTTTLRVNNHIKNGKKLFNSGKFNEALEEYKQGLALDPNNAQLWYLSAVVESILRNQQAALERINKAIELDGGNQEYLKQRKTIQSRVITINPKPTPVVTPKKVEPQPTPVMTPKKVEPQPIDQDGRIRKESAKIRFQKMATVVGDKRAVIGGLYGEVLLVDTDTLKPIIRCNSQHEKWIASAAMFSDGRMVSASFDGVIKVTNNKSLCVTSMSLGEPVISVAVLEPNKIISGSSKRIVIWDATTGVREKELPMGVSGLFAIDDNRIAVANNNKSAQFAYEFKVLQKNTLEEIKTIKGVSAEFFLRMPNGHILGLGRSDQGTGYIIFDNDLKVIKKAKCNISARFSFVGCVVDHYLVCSSEKDTLSQSTLYILDLDSGIVVKKIPRAHTSPLPDDATTISWVLPLSDNKIATGSMTDVIIWDCNKLLPNPSEKKAHVKDKLQWVAEGDQYYKQQNYIEALLCFENALSLQKDYLPAKVGKANVLYTTGKFYDSYYLFMEARITDPSNLNAWYGEILCLLEVSPGKAKKCVYDALIKFPNDAQLKEYKARLDRELAAKPSIVDELKALADGINKQDEQDALAAAEQQKKEREQKIEKIQKLMSSAKQAFANYDLKTGRKMLEEVLNLDVTLQEAKDLLKKYSPRIMTEQDKSSLFSALNNGNEQEALLYAELATNKNELCQWAMKYVLFFSKQRSYNFVSKLIDYGYVPNNVNLVLCVFLEHNETKIFELLLKQPYTFVLDGDEPESTDNSVLAMACKLGNRQAFKQICEKFTINDHHWWLALQACIKKQDAEFIGYLVEQLPDGPNQIYRGMSFLMHAVVADCVAVVEALLDSGADLAIKCTQQNSEYCHMTAKEIAQSKAYAAVLAAIEHREPKEPNLSLQQKPDDILDKLLSEIDEVTVSPGPTTKTIDVESQYLAPEEQVVPAPQKPKFANYQKINWSSLIQGKLIGNGGFGKVYEGHWQGITVAIKILNKEVLEPPELVAFEREAEIMSICRHPNIVTLHGACQENGHYALVLEFMPLKSLYDVHKRGVNLDWYPQRWQIALDICHAMSYLHSNNIIHRDLKSLNVLLDENYRAKVSDFGMAKVKTDSNSSNQSAAKLGTARWRAPEMIDPSKPSKPNKLTDIYALGLVLWELYSKNIPFHEALDDMTVMFWLFQGKQNDIGEDCPKILADVIRRCTAKDPAMRPVASMAAKLIDEGMTEAKKQSQAKNGRSWHFDSSIKSKATLSDNKPYVLLDAGPNDIEKVLQFYRHHPVPGMDVGRVRIVYNPRMNRQFVMRLEQLQYRVGNNAFEPKWANESLADWRKVVNDACTTLALEYYDSDFPGVKILPLWHGTDPKILDSIFCTGYANLAQTDAGFFGKGIYSALEAEYSHRVYSKGALLLNWVSFYSAYPVVHGDMAKLNGQPNYANYDAHFIPVAPQSNNPNESVYVPTKLNQKPTYHELVVFDSAQCLPRYIVELSKNTPVIGLLSMGLFKKNVNAINLNETIRHVYHQHLSKAYNLPNVDNVDWSMMDWQFSHKGTVVPRPNHGLAHTLRTSAYVHFVAQYYLDHNQNSMTTDQVTDFKSSIFWLQLSMLFFVVGRRNEIGFHHNHSVYNEFRIASGEAMRSFLISKAVDNNQLNYYVDAVVNCYSKDHAGHRVLRICHDLDLMRCTDQGVYNTKLATIAQYLGDEHTLRLKNLARHLIEHTGDRIMGDNNYLRTYESDQFVTCSTDIDRCIQQIELGLKQWQNQAYGTNMSI